MKKIEAIIRKTKFEDVKDALLEADIEWFSYYDVRGIGKARQGRIYRGVVYDTSTIERILISIVAVSYTHLDVYKRQAVWLPTTVLSANGKSSDCIKAC